MPQAGEGPTKVSFFYDVVCPYSYLESHVMEQAEDDGQVEVQWLPYELRPAPRALLDPRGDHLRVDWTQNVYRRALGLGVEIHLPRYQPRSTLPLAACLWADDAGRLREFRRALYEAFFCEGRDIAAEGEIARAAERAGLGADDAISAAYSGARIARIGEIRAAAEGAEVRGVPSLLTDDGQTHWGMGGLERMLDGLPLVPRGG
jgi:predicted DsbA family dithiol-disulfide isomerase